MEKIKRAKNRYSGFYKIFQFTFQQRVKAPGLPQRSDHRRPAVPSGSHGYHGLRGAVRRGGRDPAQPGYHRAGGGDRFAGGSLPGAGRLLGLPPEKKRIINQLNGLGREGYTDISYQRYDTPQEALEAARGMEDTVVLAVERAAGGDQISLVLPEDSNLTKSDLEGLESFIGSVYPYIQMQRTGLTPQELTRLTAPVAVETHRSAAGDTDPLSGLKEALAYLLPYLNIMVLYFMVLFYGQGVSTSVLMEKTSKLMDTMLLAARPGGMVIGKVLAQALAGILQIFIWLAALAGGFWGGALLVRAINPDSEMLLLQLFDLLGGMSGLFAVSAVIAALLQVAAGFLLYCSLAAIGGAMAGKQEDLSSTNLLFTLALIGSFLAALYSGGLGVMSPSSMWLNWVPFTAVMIVPGRVLLGQIPLWQAYGSLAVVLASFVLVCLLAGKIYKNMALYKGQVPGFSTILKMIKS